MKPRWIMPRVDRLCTLSHNNIIVFSWRNKFSPLTVSTCLSISSLSTRPPSPLPRTSLRLTPHSRATLRTVGVARTFPAPAEREEGATIPSSSSLLSEDDDDWFSTWLSTSSFSIRPSLPVPCTCACVSVYAYECAYVCVCVGVCMCLCVCAKHVYSWETWGLVYFWWDVSVRYY